MKPIHVVASQDSIGEGPLWNVPEQAIYWLDITGKKLHRYYVDSKKYETFDMEKRIGVIAFRKQGGLILGAEDSFYFWDANRQVMKFISHPEIGKTEARFNDGKVDRKGRFWAGTMTAEGATSALYRVDPDLSVHQMVSGVTISNGIGWSPDNKTMYFADLNRHVIHTFDFDLQSGAISHKRDFVKLDESFGVPDGLTVDTEGYVWFAVYDGWKVMRYSPDGNVAGEINMPVSRPSSCMFGGKDLTDLYITTISEGLSDQEKAQQPLAGDLFVVHAAGKGLPETDFEG